MNEPEFATSQDSLWNKIPEHLRGGLTRYLNNHIKPGDFLTAVLTNNLMGAFKTGDEKSLASIKDIIAYLYWEVGMDCYGTQEKFNSWIVKGLEEQKTNYEQRDSSG